MRQMFKQERRSLRLGPTLEASTVVVCADDSGRWSWHRIAPTGVVTRSSAATFNKRDEATESAYRSNPGTPVQVELLHSTRPA